MLIKPINDLTEQVTAIVQLSRDYQASLYPPESINQDKPEELVNGRMYFIGAYGNDDLYGIGGVKLMHDDGDYGEIKNLFVDPHHRGRGVSRAIMHELERYLVEQGIKICRLETGILQPESLGLYRDMDYRQRDAYGSYRSDPNSVFMEKVIE